MRGRPGEGSSALEVRQGHEEVPVMRRNPKWCPFCRKPLTLKVLRFEYTGNPRRTSTRERYVCEPCGIDIRIGPWPKPQGHTSNGWRRIAPR